VRGKGCKVWDDKGREYLDFTAGIAVCGLGHCHPKVTETIERQAKTLIHVSNLYWTVPQIEVARLLTKNSFAERVFFCNSGAEAVEGALKLARRHGHENRGPDCYQIISLEDSFHGRTLATLAATGQPLFQKGFEPMPSGFIHIPRNDINALKQAASPRTAAILIEPIQGEGGVLPVNDDFLLAAREICDSLGALLIFDEVQVGMGRTGTLFAYEQTPVIPDVICLAKALGNGFPIGAMLAKNGVMSYLPPGSHASTFGGNPLACAVAKTVIEMLTEPGFLDNVKEMGTYLKTGLESLAKKHHKAILEVRGKGLIQAIEFKKPRPELGNQLMKAGLLVLVSREKTLRLVPPLIITKKEINTMLETLENNI
jgi:predicted acetylornithine/succinylornithine family transaminase